MMLRRLDHKFILKNYGIMPTKEIAERLGCQPQTVYNIVNDSKRVSKLSEVREFDRKERERRENRTKLKPPNVIPGISLARLMAGK